VTKLPEHDSDAANQRLAQRNVWTVTAGGNEKRHPDLQRADDVFPSGFPK